jgi:glycosyltransferase involved in cell wall biosynthesis
MPRVGQVEMRILHFVSYTEFGGIETYTRDLYAGLENANHQNIVMFTGHELPGLRAPGRLVMELPGLHTAGPSADRRSVEALSAALRAAPPDIALFHTRANAAILEHVQGRLPTAYFAHEYTTCCPAGTLYFRRRNRVCTVSEAPNWRCLLNAYVEGCNTRRPGGLMASFTSSRQLKGWATKADAVICPSQYVAERHRLAGYDPSRTHVLPIPAPLPQLPAIEADEPPSVLFSGRLVSTKGVQVLLQAMVRVRPDCVLNIVGDGPYRRQLELLVAELTLETRVRFLGSVPHEDCAELIGHASIVVVPSLLPEPFGMSGPEAQGCERAVVASRIGGIAEWLVEGETGLGFPAGDASALAECINRLIADRGLRRRLGMAGRALVERRFSLPGHIGALETILEQVRQHREP